MVAGMKKSLRLPNGEEQAILDGVQVRLIERAELEKFNRLLDEHHYLGGQQAVGERLQYLALSREGEWLALLVFSAAAKHLKHRDQWIGWSSAQRHRRLSLVTNNSRFLILPERSVPNLATKVLRLTLDRLSLDWQVRYGHPVLVVETFVDPVQFRHGGGNRGSRLYKTPKRIVFLIFCERHLLAKEVNDTMSVCVVCRRDPVAPRPKQTLYGY